LEIFALNGGALNPPPRAPGFAEFNCDHRDNAGWWGLELAPTLGIAIGSIRFDPEIRKLHQTVIMEQTIQSNTQIGLPPAVSVSRQRTCGNIMVRLLYGLVFLGVGIFVLVWGFKNLKHARTSVSWSSVSGMIVASDVEQMTSRTSSGGEEIRYVPRIRYEYKVDGIRYASGRISFGGRTLHKSPDAAEAELADFPVGKAVPVYHDPAAPSSSVLKPGVSGSVYLVFAGGLLFILLGLLVAFGKSGVIKVG
jgi:hypothetical protein